MKPRHLLAALLAACSLGATAQTLKPGLWEVTNKVGGSPQVDKAMADMQKQMASMTPEQRKMMQDMMAKQGVNMSANAGGGMSLKICMTKEMVERNEMPQQQGDCKTTMSPRVGNTMKMSFVCTQPPSSGEGQISFVSPEAYNMQVTSTTTVKGKPEKMNLEGSGKWLSADCGSVKPPIMPKK